MSLIFTFFLNFKIKSFLLYSASSLLISKLSLSPSTLIDCSWITFLSSITFKVYSPSKTFLNLNSPSLLVLSSFPTYLKQIYAQLQMNKKDFLISKSISNFTSVTKTNLGFVSLTLSFEYIIIVKILKRVK